MARGKNLTGQRFGKLTVIDRTGGQQNHYSVWRCRCDCGKEILVDTRRLMRGTVKDCGCVETKNACRGREAEDLTGRIYGQLTVLYRVENKGGRTCWRCRCTCGNEKDVTAHDLKAGKVKSCGCLAYSPGRNRVDITGRRFGRLTALYPTEKRDRRGSVYWHCRCDCGNETDVTETHLVHGNYRSCGCLNLENQQKISEKLHHIDGTCVEILEKRKHRNDNKSGFRGVYKTKNGRYRVDIGFQRKRFYIGSYDSFYEAVEMRLRAEHILHDRFVEEYYEWKKRADADPEWGKDNPLKFEADINGIYLK